MATRRRRQRRRPTGGYYTGTDRKTTLPTPRRGRRRSSPAQRQAAENRDRALPRSVQNTQQQEIALDLAQLTLDITGILDPTPISDGTNMLISLARGKWTEALISGVSLVPYLGDLAKLGKLKDYSDTVRLAKEIAKTDPKWRKALRQMFTPLKALLDNVAQAGADTLPLRVRQWLRQVRYEVDEFLEHAPKLGSAPAQKSTAASPPPSTPRSTTYGTGETKTIRRVEPGDEVPKDAGAKKVPTFSNKQDLAKKQGDTPEQIAARKEVATEFYTKQGYDPDTVPAHIEGIDLSQPVEVTVLKKVLS